MNVSDMIVKIAEELKEDGLLDWSKRLLNSADGVFNNTEIIIKWKWEIQHILNINGLSDRTLADSHELLDKLEELLK